MNKVIVDNWNLEKLAYEITSFNKDISTEYGDFLSAIILWDDLYYIPNNMFCAWKQIFSKLEEIVRPISFTNRDLLFFEKESLGIYNKFYSHYPDVVAKGAINYLLLCNATSFDYFPSGERQKFFNENNPYDVILKFTRFDFMKPVDKFIEDQFIEMFKIFGKASFQIKRPVLVDFILQNTPSGMTHIEYALHLKYEGPVVKYRQYLTDIEKAIEKCEWKYLNELVQYSEDIVKKIINMDKKSIGGLKVVLVPVPSIEFSKEINIQKRRMQLCFLDDLVGFAFNYRKI